MLETKYAKFWLVHQYVVLEIIPFNPKALLIFLISAFLAKKKRFYIKIVPLFKAIV